MLNNNFQKIIQSLPYLLGLGLIFVGVVGFLPDGHKILGIHAHHVTYQHNFIHLLTGAGLIFFWYSKIPFTKIYLTLMACLYLVMVLLGIALGGNIFNIVFAFRDDHILHFSIAMLCIWFGYFPPFATKKLI
jgi:Domain of unknown function (DUF4383)